MVGLPVIFAIHLHNFLVSTEVKTYEQWVTVKEHYYPNLTICHPKYFSADRMKSKTLGK